MKYRTLIKSFAVILFILMLYFILSEFKPRKETNSLEAFEPDGIEMKYIAFDKNNQKTLEINCAESKRAENDKTIMKKIRATVYKRGELDQDIHITADRGYATSNIHRFFIEKNATIISEDLEVRSDNFMVVAKNKMSTEEVVHYRSRGLSGIARKGLEFYIKVNVLKLFDTRGTYVRNDQTFDYKTALLWVIDKNHSVVFKTGTEIISPDTTLTSDDLVFLFDDQFEKIKESRSNENSTLVRENNVKGETMKIRSKVLKGFYTPSGKLETAVARRLARMTLEDPENRTHIAAHLIRIHFNPETGQISEIKMTREARIQNSGKSDFTISAPEIRLWFSEGELVKGLAEENCSFQIKDYSGNCPKMTYHVDKNLIHLQGEGSTLKRDQNTFIADEFKVDTEKDILSSEQNIKSIFVPQTRNALFSRESVFVHSKRIEIHHRDNTIRYRDGVRLQQNRTIMTAENLEISEQNRMEAKGSAALWFREKEDEIKLSGDHLIFNPSDKNITIKGNGDLRNRGRSLQAKLVKVTFNAEQELENIHGENQVRFSKDQIQGSSNKVNWDYKQEIMLFSESALLKSQNQGTTKGDKLRLNLKDNQITILTDLKNRSETIIQ